MNTAAFLAALVIVLFISFATWRWTPISMEARITRLEERLMEPKRAQPAVLTINFSWEEVEPDGEQCVVCRERCFLNQFERVGYVVETGKTIKMNVVVCGSCKECCL